MAKQSYIIDGDLMQAVVSRIGAAPAAHFYDVYGALAQTIQAQDQAFAAEAAKANEQENAKPLETQAKAD